MPKSIRKTITVEGRFPFPIDMMRYDACWPASERDSSLITATFERTGGTVRVDLYTHEKFSPTPGRWESFGWKVIDAS